MTATCNKWSRELSETLDRMWPDWTIQRTGGNHLKIIIRHKGRHRVIFTSSTPSDWRVLRNFEAKVRSTIRELKEEAA